MKINELITEVYNQHYVKVSYTDPRRRAIGEKEHVSTFASKPEAESYMKSEKAKGNKVAYKFLKGGAGVTTSKSTKQPFIDR